MTQFKRKTEKEAKYWRHKQETEGERPGVGFQLSIRNQLEIGMHVNEFDLKNIRQIDATVTMDEYSY